MEKTGEKVSFVREFPGREEVGLHSQSVVIDPEGVIVGWNREVGFSIFIDTSGERRVWNWCCRHWDERRGG